MLSPSTLIVDSPMQPDDDFPSMTKLDLLQIVCLSMAAAIFAFAGRSAPASCSADANRA